MSPFRPYTAAEALTIDAEDFEREQDEPRPQRGRPKQTREVVYRPLSEAQKTTIRERLRFGETIQALADEYRLPVSKIVAVAQEIVSVDPGSVIGGKFRKQARVELIDDMANAIWELLHDSDKRPSAGDLRNLSIATGVIIDKRRLEEGLSTSHAETHSTVTQRKVWSRRAMPTMKKK